MKVLFIGGTGNISSAVSRIAIERGIDLYVLNRGNRQSGPKGIKQITGDISSPDIIKELNKHTWDAVVNWIAFLEDDVKRDYSLFNGRTKQYVFISSASIYQKPPSHPVITESTPLANPYWEYSRNKIACEERLMNYYRDYNFPITIVRPSHTYNTVIPVPIGGWTEYTIIERIKKGRKIIVPGDGTSLWVLTYADDFAHGFLGLLGNPQVMGNAFHITSDELLTWDQIHEIIADAVGTKADIIHIPSDVLARYDEELVGSLIGDKAHSVIFDNTKIKRFVPGFVCTTPFSEGIRKTLSWFEADSARQIIKQETHEWMDKMIDKWGAIG